MGVVFGTDGVRGIANKELNVNLAFELGKAGAFVLAGENKHTPKVIVGTDTRISSDMFCSAVEAGLCAMGANVIRAGVVTTPAVAYLTRHYACDAGIVISASHNSYEYNGIKFFDSNGFKLPDETEEKIESILTGLVQVDVKTHNEIGRIYKEKDCKDIYIDYLLSHCNEKIENMNILLDCANGAASNIAPEVFIRCGCNVTVINATPDGLNINKACGSTHIDTLKEHMSSGEYDIGFAYDGDADRVIAVSDNGRIIDGDVLIAVLAMYLKERNLLNKDTIAVSELGNMALDVFAKRNDLKIVRTKVGDRYVVEEMYKNGYSIGGEQSGHIILLPYATTGDGILASLIITRLLFEKKIPSHTFFDIIKPLPQVMINVKVKKSLKTCMHEFEHISILKDEIENSLSDSGRIILRVSGTEPVIRVMIEGPDMHEIEKMAGVMANTISQCLN